MWTKMTGTSGLMALNLSWRRSLLYRNQSTDLVSKSMDWFLYDKHLRYERVNKNRLKKVLVIAKHKHFVNIKASYHRKQYRFLRKNIFRNRRKSFMNFKWQVSKITKFNKLYKQDIPTITYLFILFRNNNNSVFTANFCCSSCFGFIGNSL